MIDKKLLYILLATYNGEKFLKEQLDSLFRQTYQNWVLWIHDDNSKDNTVSVIKEYKSKYPDNIKFLDDDISTGGAKENFTYLLEKIDENFDYLMFCDQDDVWLDTKIEITLNKMLEVENKNKNKSILIHTDLKVVGEDLITISKSMFSYQKLNIKNQYDIEKLALDNIITGCTVMINKEAFKSINKIPKEAIMHDWWIGLCVLKNNGIIEFVHKTTILYRQHSLNSIGSKQVNFKFYLAKVLDIFSTFKQFKLLYAQINKIGIKMSFFKLIILKLILISKKIKEI